jgi:hypothetical protein
MASTNLSWRRRLALDIASSTDAIDLMHSRSRNPVLTLVGVTLVLHCAEEYLTFPAFFSSPDAMPHWLHPHGLLYNAQHMRVALVMAAVLPLGVIAWAILRPRHWLLVAVLVVEAVLLVNAGWHVAAALVRRGYAPGVITAVLINLPFGVYVLQRAVREQWIRPRTAWRLVTVALVLHFAALGSLLAG